MNGRLPTDGMESKSKSPKESDLKKSLEGQNIPGGYDGERSPLQPPIRETFYDEETGKVSAELIVDSETGSTYNEYHPGTDQLTAQKVRRPDGGYHSCYYGEDGIKVNEWDIPPEGGYTSRSYSEKTGQITFEETRKPDGSSTVKSYQESGEARYTITSDLDGSQSNTNHYRDGRPAYAELVGPDGSRTYEAYDQHGNIVSPEQAREAYDQTGEANEQARKVLDQAKQALAQVSYRGDRKAQTAAEEAVKQAGEAYEQAGDASSLAWQVHVTSVLARDGELDRVGKIAA